MNKRVYLDHAATTQMSEHVLKFMFPYLREEYGNPSSAYDLGVDNQKVLMTARKKIAAALGCEPHNIVFTSGGTESDNWALIGTAESRSFLGRHIITTKIEHHAVLESCQYLEKRGFEITYLDVDEMGRVTPEQVAETLRQDTILVSVMTANNEIGTIQPIQEIGSVLKNHQAYFHTDAVQAFCQIPVTPQIWNVDLLSASSHKFYGPKGVGFLYIKDGIEIAPFLHGGKQERGIRAGTENVAAIAGMGEAAAIAEKNMVDTIAHERKLRDYMIRRMEREIPCCRLNGPRKNRLPGNVNISFSFSEGGTAVIMLDMEGVCCSSGSACMSGQSGVSHVLQGIHLPDDVSRGSLRFSIGKDTTEEEIDYAVDKCKEVIARARDMNPAYRSYVKRNLIY